VLGGLGGPGGGRSGGVRGPGDARAHGKGGGEVDGHQEGPGDQVVHGGDLDECCPFEAKRSRQHRSRAVGGFFSLVQKNYKIIRLIQENKP
jgi:hypothetical protein